MFLSPKNNSSHSYSYALQVDAQTNLAPGFVVGETVVPVLGHCLGHDFSASRGLFSLYCFLEDVENREVLK